MPERYIPLDRRFSKLDESEQLDASTLAYLGRAHGELAWPDLLKRRRVVVLAEARSGKTSEFREQTSQLRTQGFAAFAIPLDILAESDLAHACAPDQALLEDWLSSDQDAWFFLDARDEAKISGKSFRRALANLQTATVRELARAHIFISSRVSDWEPRADFELFKRLLQPPKAETRPQQIADEPINADIALLAPLRRLRNKGDSTVDAPDDGGPIAVVLSPLNTDCITRLASAWGITEVDAFLNALKQADAVELASRPGDLEGLVELWKKHAALGSYQSLLSACVDTRLSDLRRIAGAKVHLDHDNYLAGARRLAATLALTRRDAFRAPDNSDDSVRDESTTIATGAFPDWQPESVDAVLRTGLFDPHSYGRVRFHSRAVREYLAAQWIMCLKQVNGLTAQDLAQLLFAQSYGEDVVIPSMRPVAAWVALNDAYVREEILRRDPEILLSVGDPAGLDVPTKRKLLGRSIQEIAARPGRWAQYDDRVLRAVADVRLISDIETHWRAQKGCRSARSLLMQVIRYGHLTACVDLVYSAAIAMKASSGLQQLAIRTLAELAEAHSLAKLAKHALSHAQTWPADVLEEILGSLFPVYLTVGDALTLLDELLRRPESPMRPRARSAVQGMVQACAPAVARLKLLQALAERLESSRPNNESDEAAAWRKLLPSFLALATRVLDEDSPDVLHDTVAMNVGRGCGMLADQFDIRDERRAFATALLAWKGRAKLFWQLLATFETWGPRAAGAPNPSMRVWYTADAVGLQAGDIDWLLAGAATNSAIRAHAIEASLRLWHQGGRIPSVLAQIRVQCRADAPLLQLVADSEHPRPNPDHSQFQTRMREREEEQERQDKEHDAAWKAFIDELRSRPQILTDSAITSTPRHFGDLWNLRSWMEAKSLRQSSAGYSIANWTDLREPYGEEVAVAAAEAFKAYWRQQHALLPSERAPEERNQIHRSTIIALTGLAIEASTGDVWIEQLTDSDVERAVRIGLRELNGLPAWMANLVRKRPNPSYRILLNEAKYELLNVAEDARSDVLERLRQQTIAEWPELPPRLITLLEASVGTEASAVSNVVDILTGTDGVHRNAIAALARTCLARDDLTEITRTEYLRLLLASDAAQATNYVAGWIRGKGAIAPPTSVEQVFATLGRDGEGLNVRFRQGTRTKALEILIRLAFGAVSPQSDVIHEDVYSPGVREHAEHTRNWLMKELIDTPGRGTYDALHRLACWKGMGLNREWLIAQARERAEADCAVAWSPQDVAEFERSRTRKPKSGRDLFELSLQRLKIIADHLAHSDFSQKELLRGTGVSERHVQLWLADRLQGVASGSYAVVREDEVIDAKKPDIRLFSVEANAKIAVEVKVADSWTGNQLAHALTDQLIGRYQRDLLCSHGVLVLVNRGVRNSWTIKRRRTRSFEELVDHLDAIAKRPRRRGEVDLVSRVIGISLGGRKTSADARRMGAASISRRGSE